MTLPFTSVVGFHMNPMACGVAKFNAELAKRLGVPFVSMKVSGNCGHFPLFSIKASEMPFDTRIIVPRLFGVFAHDDVGDLATEAAIVFHADPSLGPNGLWCPSLLTPSKPRIVRLFSMGMAHKLQTQHYRKVRALLDAAGLDYRLRVSVALHEGTSLSDATQHFDALKDILGEDKVTILGCLSDDAVVEELDRAHVMLAFFAAGLRANNTTVHAALDARRPVITNCDAQSPWTLRDAVMDINAMARWPVREDYSWENLISEMEKVCARSQSATV